MPQVRIHTEPKKELPDPRKSGELQGTLGKNVMETETEKRLRIRSHPSAQPKHELRDLLCWVQKNFPEADPEPAFTVSLWDSISVQLYDTGTLRFCSC